MSAAHPAQERAGPASRVRFSPLRTWWIAQNTLRDAVRQRLLVFIALVALALVLGARWLREFNFGSSELGFTADFGFAAIALFGGVLTIAATVQLFLGEIEARTVAALLAKPVRRSEFVLAKFAAVAVLAAVFCAVMLAALAAVLWLREAALRHDYPEAFARGRALALGPLAAAGFAQWLKLLVLAALTLLVASFARTPLFAVATSFLVWLSCQLQFAAQSAAAHGGPAWSRASAEAIAVVLPDFALFDFTGVGGNWPGGERLLRMAVYALVYATVAVTLAAFSFRRREI